jgi:hypothetical protein
MFAKQWKQYKKHNKARGNVSTQTSKVVQKSDWGTLIPSINIENVG